MAGCLEKIIVAFSSKGVSAEFFLLSVCVRYLREGTCVDCGGEDVLQIIRAVFIKIAEVFCTMCSPDLKDLLEAVQARHPLDLGRIPKYACYPCGGDSFLRRSIFDHYHTIQLVICLSEFPIKSQSVRSRRRRRRRPLFTYESSAPSLSSAPPPPLRLVLRLQSRLRCGPTDRPTDCGLRDWMGRRSRRTMDWLKESEHVRFCPAAATPT